MSEPIQQVRVFISHTHEDKGLADALNNALVRLFDRDVVRVSYSSKKHEAGAPRGGENWFEWIVEQVKGTTVAFVLLTPASVNKPWVLWEAGAVQGVAFGDADGGGDRVLPLSYALKAGDVPTPFQAFQVSAGDLYEDMKKVFRELINAHLPRERIFDAVDRLNDVLDQYMKAVAVTLRNAPMLPTEPVVQEWLLRLDELRGQGRASEVGHVHDWLNVAFGRERGETERPLDFRIHRRLGELYMRAGNHGNAARQFELARSLAPRDLQIMRQLGQALLVGNDTDAAGGVIVEIERLDAKAFAHNVECAALKGRWHEARKELELARDVYREGLANSSQSYYLADLLGQVLLALADRDGARDAYAQATRILDEGSDRSIWVHATAATAAIVDGREDDGTAELRKIRAFNPGVDELSSIERGLVRLQTGLNADGAAFARWCAALRGREAA